MIVHDPMEVKLLLRASVPHSKRPLKPLCLAAAMTTYTLRQCCLAASGLDFRRCNESSLPRFMVSTWRVTKKSGFASAWNFGLVPNVVRSLPRR